MAQPINEEIAAAWRALAGDAAEEGWRGISITGAGSAALMAARHFPSNTEALMFGFENVMLPAASAMPSGAGFRVEKVSTGRPGQWMALVREAEGSLEMFARMSADIVVTLAAREHGSEQHMFELFIGRIRAWQHFMSRPRGALSPEAELGLAGELECLQLLMHAGLSAYAVVDGWKGPLDGLQDFELGSGAVEVKSTLSQSGFPATIMSLEQLDDSILQPLFLCGCRFSLGAGGTALPQRIGTVREQIAHDRAALALFESALLHAGFLDAHSEFYTRRFMKAVCRFVLVDDAFPRLTPGSVPPGIRAARYGVDLDAVTSPHYDIPNILRMTGALTWN